MVHPPQRHLQAWGGSKRWAWASLLALLPLAMQPREAHGACAFDPSTNTYSFSGADLVPGFSCTAGDKTYKNFSDTSSTPGALGSANFKIAVVGLGVGSLHKMTVELPPSGFQAGSSYGLDYEVMAPFKTIMELSTAATFTDLATAEASATLADSMLAAMATFTVIPPDPVDQINALIFPPTDTLTLNAMLEVKTGSSSALVWEQTIKQVPGPLPMLGTAVAWGASRGLRRRLRLAQRPATSAPLG